MKCLKEGHFVKDCKANKRCYFCKGNHNSILCFKKFEKIGLKIQLVKDKSELSEYEDSDNTDIESEDEINYSKYENESYTNDYEINPESEEEESSLISKITAETNNNVDNDTLLMTISVEVKKENNLCNTYAFLDSGSQKSFITENLAKKLSIEPTLKKELNINTFGNSSYKSIKTWNTEIELKLTDGSYLPIKVLVVPTIAQKIQLVKTPQKLWKSKNNIEIKKVIPEILIGSDFYWKICLPTEQNLPSGFYSLKTKLGNMIVGNGKLSYNSKILNNLSLICHNMTIEDKLRDFWSLEQIGIQDSPLINDDDLALKNFQKTILQKDKRYFVQWPFKKENINLSNNFGICFGRLQSSLKKLKFDNKIEDYDIIIKEQLDKGIIEEVTFTKHNEAIKNNHVIHYIPHQAVYKNDKKTTKLRIVYDASAKSGKEFNSLNEIIMRGPVLLPDLCGMLLRFRLGKIIILSDIEKAFLQVGLQEIHRDVTRFLWIKDKNKPVEKDNLITYRFTRVTFGINASPFLLAATIKHHLSKYNNKLANEISRNSYVDNIMMTANTYEEALEKYKSSKEIFKDAHMNLREFVSNHKQLNKFFNEHEEIKVDINNKVLGLNWDLQNDTISYLVNIPENFIKVTKREVLHQIAKIYDPLGLISPAILNLKLFYQSLWKNSLKWDDILPNELIIEWNNLTKEFRNNVIIFPRKTISENENVSLHIFADASIKAFAAVGYLVTKNESNLVFAKTRVNPTKEITIPRLELLAVLIASRMSEFLTNEISIKLIKTYIWTDSSCVCGWSNTNKELPRFVANRINEIKKKKVNIKYVPTLENPADIASRGMNLENLKLSKLWKNGPEWITKDETFWPKVKFENNSETTVLSIVTNDNLIKLENTSSYKKLLCIMMKILFFLSSILKHNSKLEKLDKNMKIFKSKKITPKHIQVTENVIFRYLQYKYPPSKLELTKLNIYKDEDNILRCRSRIENSNLKFNQKRPIFLPNVNNITKLIIMNIHLTNLHSGTNLTLSSLRNKFWINKGRSLVQKTIKGCLGCIRQRSVPYSLPNLPDYPSERVSKSAPFTYIGLDYMGPITVKINNETNKYWVSLFTCMATRAIHLEIVSELSAMAFLQCFKRFISRRGVPLLILSDNGTQFVLASKFLNSIQEIINEDVENYFNSQKITWKFITEYAPWQGGFYERMNGLVKNTFRKAVGKRLLPLDDFHTLICEIESIVNNRPLIYLGDDIDSIEILRPIDFLLPEKSIDLHNNYKEKEEEYFPQLDSVERLRYLWERKQSLLKGFWNIWYNDYLLSLRERYQIKHKESRLKTYKVPEIGDIVLIHEDLTPKNLWSIAEIIGVRKSKDGKIRSATVLTAKHKRLDRPINLLYHLEGVNLSENNSNTITMSVITNKVKLKSLQSNELKTYSQKCTNKNNSIINCHSMLIFLLLIFSSNAYDNQCLENNTNTIIYSTECAQKGYALRSVTSEKLCYIYKECSTNQHLKLYNNSLICDKKCECPSWTHQCSFYKGNLAFTSKIDNLNIKKELQYQTPQICSFTLQEHCDTKPETEQLYTIELYDFTKHYVRNLAIKNIYFYDNKDYFCYGEGENIIGSNYYCSNHTCHQTGNKFCHYNLHDELFYIGEHSEFLIQSWGKTNVTYYKHKEIIIQPDIISQCVKGGIIVQTKSSSTINLIKACSQFQCVSSTDIKPSTILLFSPSTTLATYKVNITTWYNGTPQKAEIIECPGQQYCDLINCTFCKAKLFNYDCYSITDWIILIAIIYLLLFLLYPISLIISFIFFITRILIKILFRTCKINNSTNHSQLLSRRSVSYRRKLLLPTILTLLLILHHSDSCHDISSLTVSDNECIRNEKVLQCNLRSKTRLTLNPYSETCLIIKKENLSLGELKLKVLSNEATCNKKSLFFTRNHELLVQSIKRCSRVGSCVEKTCANLKPYDQIEELDQEINDLPGYALCSESCGGWFCGCFSPESGCLFYKVYAKPKNQKIYEVFTCPSWNIQVRLQLTGKISDQLIQQEFILTPSIPIKKDSIKITLTSYSNPPLPILNNKFILGENKILVLDKEETFLNCENKEKAQDFNCTFPLNSCNCISAETKTSCNCKSDPIDHIFYQEENILPLELNNFLLLPYKDNVKTEFRAQTALNIQLQLDHYTVETIINENTCELKQISLEGCYSCKSGAKFTYSCSTNFGKALANVKCKNFQFTINCDEKHKENTIQILINEQVIDEECIVYCPAKNTAVAIKGILFYVDDKISTWNNIQGEILDKNNEDITFIDLLQNIKNLKDKLASFGYLIFIIILLIFLLPLITPIIVKRIIKKKFKSKIKQSKSKRF